MRKNTILLMESNSSLSAAISVYNEVYKRENGTLDTFRSKPYLIGSIQVQTQYTNLSERLYKTGMKVRERVNRDLS